MTRAVVVAEAATVVDHAAPKGLVFFGRTVGIGKLGQWIEVWGYEFNGNMNIFPSGWQIQALNPTTWEGIANHLGG